MSFLSKISKSNSAISVAEQIILKNAIVYGLWMKQQNGHDAYFVLEIDKPKHQNFLNKVDAGEIIKLYEYGKIIYSGWKPPMGKEREYFYKKYGMYESAQKADNI